jgi:solute carrier family 25 protein 39/40
MGILAEFRLMIQDGGISSLFRGVYPTLMRDIPFSAVYWICIESMRDFWRNRRQNGTAVSAWEQAGQAMVNGSVSGIIAAAVTTPLDVIKTRIQVGGNAPTPVVAVAQATAEPVCDHGGALAYRHASGGTSISSSTTTTTATSSSSQSTIHIARTIVQEEGISGLWRGNTARMMKVAPACAIMISSYEIGKRLLIESD